MRKLILLLALTSAPAYAHSVLLNWTASTSPSVTYTVLRAPTWCAGAVAFQAIATGLTTTTYTDAAPGIINCYEVVAVDPSTSAWSSPTNQVQIVLLYPPMRFGNGGSNILTALSTPWWGWRVKIADRR